jgi:glyoxylase-like metal-dependent hydrolase (beta-lactamase superfamily II)
VNVTAYTGHVEPDGAWQDRLDGSVRVRKLSVGSFDNNVYVVSCARTSESLLIDAAAAPERLAAALADTSPLGIVQTHGHWDHVRAWEALRSGHGLEVWGHSGDAALFPAPLDRELGGGERLAVGYLEVEVLHLPGHTPGSMLFLVAGAERLHLFSGDTLFPGGPGRTTDPAAFDQIMDGLQRQVFDRLPDDTWVYPGHGDDTTLGAERGELAAWRARGW